MPQSNNRLHTFGLFTSILIGLIYLFRNFILGKYLFLFDDVGSDTLAVYYPKMLEFLNHTKESFPTSWSFNKGTGANIFSNNLLDITNWPGMLMDYKSQAGYIVIRQLLRIFIASIFIFQYFKLLELSSIVRNIATVLFTFCGYMTLTSGWYAHTEFMLNFAICLFGIELLLQKNKWWPLSIGMVLMFSAKIVFFFEFCAIYYIMRVVSEPDFSLDTFKKHSIAVLKSGLLSILLLGPFLGSMIYELIYSPRVGGDASYVKELSSNPVFELGSASEYWTAVLRFFSPDFLGSGNNYSGYYNYLEGPNFYIGLLSVLLFSQAFTLFSKKKKIIFGSIISFWILLVIFPFIRHAFYFFSGNYYKGAISIYLPFTFLYITVLSLNEILKEQKINLAILWSSCLILIMLLFFGTSISIGTNSEISKICAIFLLIYSVLLTIITKTKKVNYVSFALFAFVFLEVLYMGNITLNSRLEAAPTKAEFKKRMGHNDYTREAIDFIQSQSKPFYRVEKAYGSYNTGFNDAMAQGYFSTKTYDSFNHNHYITFLDAYGLNESNVEEKTRWVMGLVSAFYVHPIFSIKYFLTTPSTDIYVWKRSYQLVKTLNDINIYENTNYIPFGFPVENYLTPSSFAQIRDTTIKQMTLYQNILVEEKDLSYVSQLSPGNIVDMPFPNAIPNLSGELSKKAMKMESFSNDKITGTIDISKPSVVVFSMPFDVGWHAKIDGKDSPLIKVDAGLTGLPIAVGSHKIELKFIPPYLYLGCILAVLGIAWLIYIILDDRKKKRLKTIAT